MTRASDMLAAELFVDLKGAKKKRLDWMALADKCVEAVKGFGSVSKAAEKFGVSTSLFNSILRLKKLDSRVQEMIRHREILLDSAQRLNTIKPADRQYEVAKLLVGASNKKQREIIQHAKRFPDSDLVDFRGRVLGQTVRRERLRVLIMPLPEEMYQSLEDVSKRKGRPIEKLLPEIIGQWLAQSGGEGKRH